MSPKPISWSAFPTRSSLTGCLVSCMPICINIQKSCASGGILTQGGLFLHVAKDVTYIRAASHQHSPFPTLPTRAVSPLPPIPPPPPPPGIGGLCVWVGGLVVGWLVCVWGGWGGSCRPTPPLSSCPHARLPPPPPHRRLPDCYRHLLRQLLACILNLSVCLSPGTLHPSSLLSSIWHNSPHVFAVCIGEKRPHGSPQQLPPI